MFLKIKSYDWKNATPGKVIGASSDSLPKTVHPFNRVYEADYLQVRVHEIHNYKEYCDIVNPILQNSDLGSGETPVEIIGDEPIQDGYQQLMEIIITKNHKLLRIVAVGANAFLMNDEGKTVDRWFCQCG